MLEPLQHACTTSSQDEFQPRGLWGPWHHLLWGVPPSFWPPRSLQDASLPQGWEIATIWSYTQTGIGLLCLCHTCYLKVSTGNKVQWFTLVMLLFLSWSINRRLAANAKSSTYLSPVSVWGQESQTQHKYASVFAVIVQPNIFFFHLGKHISVWTYIYGVPVSPRSIFTYICRNSVAHTYICEQVSLL